MRAALLLVSFATLPLAACFGDEGGVVDATLTVTPPPTVAAASTAAADHHASDSHGDDDA